MSTPSRGCPSGAAAASLLTGLGVDEHERVLLTDALGSAVALTDAAGVVQTQDTYEPFGQTITTGAASSSPFQYTGREHDGLTGRRVRSAWRRASISDSGQVGSEN